MKAILVISRILSNVFVPLLMPTYAMIIVLWGTDLVFVPLFTRLVVLGMTFGLTTGIPCGSIFLLNKLGIITDPGLNIRKERYIPLAVALACYIGLTFYLAKIHSPEWLIWFMGASIPVTIVSLIVSFWWKISAHAAGVAGICALTFFIDYHNYAIHNNEWLFIGSLIIAALVMSSRLILQRHTIMQIIAGFFNGAFWVVISQLIAAK